MDPQSYINPQPRSIQQLISCVIPLVHSTSDHHPNTSCVIHIFIIIMKFTSAISAIALVFFTQMVTASPLPSSSSSSEVVTVALTITHTLDGQVVSTTTIDADIGNIQESSAGSFGSDTNDTFDLTLIDQANGATKTVTGSISNIEVTPSGHSW
ncbi:hypothetical protein PILCRDRAFT_512616 [Piloderma croceum F 1598]|uniref:Uncharacterized protein n=1 Tax=Piloderma croceum (strain F 1598) TaxID=765440 RepID=A0A0C3F926_PILCF|nr:hypothetical protein PILCRDRAFT_512616 [Piloderma croceum F 1598]